MVGDYNAHLGREWCGHPLPAVTAPGFALPSGKYYEGRFTMCEGSSARARSSALHRGCRRYNWLVLNGRSPSDSTGAATCRHLGKRTVLDLAICNVEARADVRVLWPGADAVDPWGHYHFPILATLWLSPPATAPKLPPLPTHRERLAAADLTPEQ